MCVCVGWGGGGGGGSSSHTPLRHNHSVPPETPPPHDWLLGAGVRSNQNVRVDPDN